MKQWIKKHGQILSLIPVILVMGMIFGFSCQTGEESGQTSDGVVSLLLQVFSPDFEELTPEAQAEIQNRVGFAVRKTAHFSEFALLGFFLMLHIRQLQKKHRVVLPWLWSWGIGTVYAMTDEAHQHFSAGRAPACGMWPSTAAACWPERP